MEICLLLTFALSTQILLDVSYEFTLVGHFYKSNCIRDGSCYLLNFFGSLFLFFFFLFLVAQALESLLSQAKDPNSTAEEHQQKLTNLVPILGHFQIMLVKF